MKPLFTNANTKKSTNANTNNNTIAKTNTNNETSRLVDSQAGIGWTMERPL